MKTNYLRNSFEQYQQQPFYQYSKNQFVNQAQKQSSLINENYQSQLIKLSVQPKQNTQRKASYQDEEEKKQQMAQAIQDQIQNNQNRDDSIQKPFVDQYSQPLNENVQKDQDIKLNTLMTKFFDVEIPNLNNFSIAYLLEELNK
ncbi:unnamed protein product (macronuclear) [Paramecium tetraurelia]|uniref:Uncharacterized protein n=1 Tax=Paramecium tetraurelia TaxID=5888 RepID=A0BSZ2_PARTE|nr:uncharacterized protein GSPATT00031891001 [Paramecium tetraurelia]CAK61659.1 unnamed protein product [Paramecium tetraurelia]|eukprot:XP_001429057.1 hypothetical protein (macronuclear) [Paramecium tetraurelia strain d4-2]